jgi:glycosyltransferase involved in cell wall biosynthesis
MTTGSRSGSSDRGRVKRLPDLQNHVAENLGRLPVVWEAKFLNGPDSREDVIHSVLGLAEQGVQVNVWPLPLKGAPADQGDGQLRSELEKLASQPPDDGAYFIVLHSSPTDFYHDEHALYRIGRTALGSARVPPRWVSAVEHVDEIWVASTFSRLAMVASGVPENKIHVMPSSVDTNLFSPTAEPLPIERGKGFAFMTLLDWDYRRGLDAVIEAYVREFRKSEDVVLVLKAPDPHRTCTVFTEGDEAASFWRELELWLFNRLRQRRSAEDDGREFESILSAVRDGRLRQELRREREVEKALTSEIETVVREESGERAKDIPAIRVVSRNLPRSMLPRFYCACDAFVMAPRGERWGRSFLEAMAVGLPTIGTKWGGHLDFMRPDNSFLVRAKAVIDVPDDDANPQCAGQQWAEPDVEHLRELMRRVYEYRGEAKERGARGASYVKLHHARSKIAPQMVKRLIEIARQKKLEGVLHPSIIASCDSSEEQEAA